MLRPNESRVGAEMNKFLEDLGAALAWIWMTPDQARRLLQSQDAQHDITFERGAFAKAA